jgi:hypothetical protein
LNESDANDRHKDQRQNQLQGLPGQPFCSLFGRIRFDLNS